MITLHAILSGSSAVMCYSLQVIRQSLATCLLLYGCNRAFLISSGLVLESEVRGLPSRYVARCGTEATTG